MHSKSLPSKENTKFEKVASANRIDFKTNELPGKTKTHIGYTSSKKDVKNKGNYFIVDGASHRKIIE